MATLKKSQITGASLAIGVRDIKSIFIRQSNTLVSQEEMQLLFKAFQVAYDGLTWPNMLFVIAFPDPKVNV
jgi:hypothetical protein